MFKLRPERQESQLEQLAAQITSYDMLIDFLLTVPKEDRRGVFETLKPHLSSDLSSVADMARPQTDVVLSVKTMFKA